MATVVAEPSLYPTNLLNGFSAQPSQRQWWVIYTKSRQEKALARHLLATEIPFFLPLVEKTNYRQGRRFRSQIPVFPGYLFLFGTDEERVRSLTANRIAQILTVDDPASLRDDLIRVQRLLELGEPLTIESRLRPGTPVRVRYGPLEGLEGTVLKRRGGTRLLVFVDFLKQGASVDIEDYMVEPL